MSVASHGSGMFPVAVGFLVAVVDIACALWQPCRCLVGAKRTQPPLLADNELGEGGTAQGAGDAAMQMGGGMSQARQVVGEQPGGGFTQC